MIRKITLFTFLTVLLISCRKDKAAEIKEDDRSKYVGEWNFKGNYYYFSGYYEYNPDPQWTYVSQESTDWNDSTGSVMLGEKPDELILKYCSSCEEVTYDLNQNGEGAWWLNENEFYNDVQPAPPGYTPAYTTYNIQGWKL